MKPEFVLLADISDRVNGVEGTHDGCACRGAHEERDVALRLLLLDQAVQLGWNNASPADRTET